MSSLNVASFDCELRLFESGYDIVLGIDEAGRGPLAGPVVAAACVLRDSESTQDDDVMWAFVRDSKTVPEGRRDAVFDFVNQKYFVGVGIVEAPQIDEINILQATFEAMRAAVGDLESEQSNIFLGKKVMVLVDGNALIPLLEKEQKTVTAGDSKVKCIAAASVIAKVTRDRLMRDYTQQYPEYGFDKHKGYGTRAHMEALVTHGATPIHRRSFGPVKRIL